jgi:hypothetical protein
VRYTLFVFHPGLLSHPQTSESGCYIVFDQQGGIFANAEAFVSLILSTVIGDFKLLAMSPDHETVNE